jgi:hypothetical protein
MMERLLARMEAKMDSNQKKAKARMAKFEEKMATDRRAKQEDLLAKVAKQEELLAEISARMDANMMKMAAIRSELEGTIKHQMQHFLSYADESTQNLPEATRIEKDPGMMQSVEEHQDVPREEAAIMPCNSGMAKKETSEKVGPRKNLDRAK